MKTIKLLGVLLLAVTLSATGQRKEVKTDQSAVEWTGNKIGGSHHGEIQIKNGYFEFKSGNIVGGKVVMDMNTITNSDLESEEYNKKLTDHLKSDDFFGVEKFPTSTFEVLHASSLRNGKATVTGILTIKDKSENISFDVYREGNAYLTQLKVDRSKFDVRYGSSSFFDRLGDKAIDDIFLLDVQLVF